MKKPFEQIVGLHSARVLRVCRAIVGPDDADDAWQETFVAALRAYPSLDDGANIEAWLVTIAHRKAIDIIRARARRAVTMEALPEPVSPNGTAGTDADDLWDAVSRLPEKQKLAVAYHYLAGLPYRDVAAIIGGSDDAARRAASDGVAALRANFAKGDQNEHVL